LTQSPPFIKNPKSAISDLTGEYFSKLKALIEETFAINGNMPVVLVCHSLGCPYTLIFLNQQQQNWKDKYLRVWLTISAPWGGSVKTLGLYASGYTLGVPKLLVNPLKLRSFQRSIKSSVYLLPSKDFWAPDHVSKIPLLFPDFQCEFYGLKFCRSMTIFPFFRYLCSQQQETTQSMTMMLSLKIFTTLSQ
jgi:hypothetical protein